MRWRILALLDSACTCAGVSRVREFQVTAAGASEPLQLAISAMGLRIGGPGGEERVGLPRLVDFSMNAEAGTVTLSIKSVPVQADESIQQVETEEGAAAKQDTAASTHARHLNAHMHARIEEEDEEYSNNSAAAAAAAAIAASDDRACMLKTVSTSARARMTKNTSNAGKPYQMRTQAVVVNHVYETAQPELICTELRQQRCLRELRRNVMLHQQRQVIEQARIFCLLLN